MNKNVGITSMLIVAGCLLQSGVSLALEADNTKVNQRDRMHDEVTADEQGQAKSDIEITQAIRKAIMDAKDFSLYAQNVKIISKDGIVTLKGPVTSMDERARVEKLALHVVGTNRLMNEMDIVSK